MIGSQKRRVTGDCHYISLFTRDAYHFCYFGNDVVIIQTSEHIQIDHFCDVFNM